MVDESRLGTIRRRPNGLSVRYVRRFRHPPERVWQALTESDHLRHWMPCDIVGERRAGATIELPFWPDHVSKYDIETPTLRGEIRVFQPPAVFEWTWDTDVLRWELAPDGDGTVLTFTTLLGDDVDGARNAAAGYHACLDNLADVLDGNAVTPLVEAEMTGLEAKLRGGDDSDGLSSEVDRTQHPVDAVGEAVGGGAADLGVDHSGVASARIVVDEPDLLPPASGHVDLDRATLQRRQHRTVGLGGRVVGDRWSGDDVILQHRADGLDPERATASNTADSRSGQVPVRSATRTRNAQSLGRNTVSSASGRMPRRPAPGTAARPR